MMATYGVAARTSSVLWCLLAIGGSAGLIRPVHDVPAAAVPDAAAHDRRRLLLQHRPHRRRRRARFILAASAMKMAIGWHFCIPVSCFSQRPRSAYCCRSCHKSANCKVQRNPPTNNPQILDAVGAFVSIRLKFPSNSVAVCVECDFQLDRSAYLGSFVDVVDGLKMAAKRAKQKRPDLAR